MEKLRRYQLEIIGPFLAMVIVLWAAWWQLAAADVDPHRYEWLLGGPFIAGYTIFLLSRRSRISGHERRRLTGATLLYWILLGMILLLSYAAPLPAGTYWTSEILFVIFTLFLADSYWDFKKLTLKNLKR